MPTVDWTRHQERVDSCKPAMIRAMKQLARSVGVKASEVFDYDGDTDFNVEFIVPRRDGNRLGVKFSIWDSGDADDGIYGQHGNFILGLVEEGGRIVGQCCPENYTDNVWVDYTDEAEWTRRLEGVIAGFDEATHMIREWRRV